MVPRPKYDSTEVLKISLKRKEKRKEGKKDQWKVKVAHWDKRL